MDVGAGLDGIARDLDELFETPAMAGVAVLTLALPLVAALLVALRQWLALVPLGLSLGVLAEWFLYYATDRWSNPGVVAWAYGLGAVLLGWALVGIAAWRAR